MTENYPVVEYTYPEKFRKLNIWGGVVTAGFIVAMHGKSRKTADNQLKRCKERLGKNTIFIKDWALHLGFSSVEEYAEETNRNLKY